MSIAKRQVVDALRNRSRSGNYALDDYRLQTTDNTPYDTWIETDYLLDLIARLPDHERVLVGLRYFDGHRNRTGFQIANYRHLPFGFVDD